MYRTEKNGVPNPDQMIVKNILLYIKKQIQKGLSHQKNTSMYEYRNTICFLQSAVLLRAEMLTFLKYVDSQLLNN